jgi:hypothetical protein
VPTPKQDDFARQPRADASRPGVCAELLATIGSTFGGPLTEELSDREERRGLHLFPRGTVP